MEERLTAAGGELLARVKDGVATVTLNRPKALNALSFAMLEGLAHWLEAWADDPDVRIVLLRGAGEKAFCAGGDVRAIHDGFESGVNGHGHFFAFEYALDYRIHTYPKPVVALLDGIVMGGGMGLSQGAAVRIVGERTKMAMPETAIGLFPDVGGSYFLSRVPGEMGTYLGLVGATLAACDAIYAGLADVYLDGQSLPRLEALLARAAAARDPAAALRDILPRHKAGLMPGCRLPELHDAIDRHFAHDRVEDIVASLRLEADPALRAWAFETADKLGKRSPTMLKVTLEQLRRGARMSLEECFRMELNLVHGCFEQRDFLEGIRAVLIEKDHAPRWNPPRLQDVGREAVDRFFTPRWTAAEHPLASLRPSRKTT